MKDSIKKAIGDTVQDMINSGFKTSLTEKDLNSLKEACRVLRNNGKLVVIEPSVKGEFQQFFHLFDDETGKIQKAYHAMMDSAFTLESKGTFDAIVRFEGKTDLCCYDFNRERVIPGDENRIINKLEQLQPGASNLSPIILKDMLDIYLLAKV